MLQMLNFKRVKTEKFALNNLVKTFRAFTLAETLLVMGIIGVIAILTIPNLSQSTNNMEKIAKVQKAYSNLGDAYTSAIAAYGPISAWQGGNTTYPSVRLGDRMLRFIKSSRLCGTGSSCFASGAPIHRDGTNATDFNANTSIPKAILADGMSVAFQLDVSPCPVTSENCGIIYIDIDGPNKGSNKWGTDLFDFIVSPKGIIPGGELSPNLLQEDCFIHGTHCAAWIIQNSSIDYLNATNGTCPNNTVLSWTVTTCK